MTSTRSPKSATWLNGLTFDIILAPALSWTASALSGTIALHLRTVHAVTLLQSRAILPYVALTQRHLFPFLQP